MLSNYEYGRNSITKKIPRYRARKSRIISPGLCRASRIRPPVSQSRRQLVFFAIAFFVLSRNLSRSPTRTVTHSHLSGYGSLQICLETMMTVCSLSILVIDKKVLGEGHAPILARLHFLTINVFGSCQRCERPGTAG